MDDVMGADELMELLGLDDVMGAPATRRMVRRGRTSAPQRSAMARLTSAVRSVSVPKVPGVAPHGGRGFPLPFTPVTFTATSGTLLTATATPSVPLQGCRLVVEAARSAATLLQAIQMRNILLGQKNQFAGAGSMSVGMVAPGAFGVEIRLDPITLGLPVSIDFLISGAALAGAETIQVFATIFGDSIA